MRKRVPANPNKRDKNAQRTVGDQCMARHGTAKDRARARNRRRAAAKREKSIGEGNT